MNEAKHQETTRWLKGSAYIVQLATPDFTMLFHLLFFFGEYDCVEDQVMQEVIQACAK
jgi:hypothetical protein